MNEIFRVVSVEATAWRNVEAASGSALEPSLGEKVKLTPSNDVSMEAFGGKRELKLADMAYRLSVRRFEAQEAYAFTRSSGPGRVLEEGPHPSTTTRDETLVKLTTVVSINALRILTSDILRKMGSMNRPRSKGKVHATVVQKVTFSEGSKNMFVSTQSEDKRSRWTRWAMWG